MAEAAADGVERARKHGRPQEAGVDARAPEQRAVRHRGAEDRERERGGRAGLRTFDITTQTPWR
eukprot:scaffold115966_cov30-Tisochrysis_lutea.AAC.1